MKSSNLAAEFYVASALFRLGYNVTLTLGNAKEIDLLVYNEKTKKTVTIDVKGSKYTTNWPMPSPKKLSPRRGHFFVLLTFKNKTQDLTSAPDIYVIPSTMVRKLWSNWSGKSKQKCIAYKKIKNRSDLRGVRGFNQLFKRV
jgi:hypothetical protein